jgi:hypothetical protein
MMAGEYPREDDTTAYYRERVAAFTVLRDEMGDICRALRNFSLTPTNDHAADPRRLTARIWALGDLL